MSLLVETIASVSPPDLALGAVVRARLDSLTKPPSSLGLLEEIALRYCLGRGDPQPRPPVARIYTFAADHGVAAEGVSAYPAAVTLQMARNMVEGGAAICVLARHAGAELQIVDVGVDAAPDALPGALAHKVRRGTRNLRFEPAMTVEEATAALETGIALARRATGDGVTLLGVGEMGIGNTTSASALCAALLPAAARGLVGRGTGIDDERLEHKRVVVEDALAAHRERLSSPLGSLAALGGLEIAALAGMVLGGAACRVPIVVDGFVATAGALAATRLCAACEDYLFFSHCSAEAAHRQVLTALGHRPILDLDLRLGEGTGSALAISIIQAALRLYGEMATFASAGIARRAGEEHA